jgi:hypothetical protein
MRAMLATLTPAAAKILYAGDADEVGGAIAAGSTAGSCRAVGGAVAAGTVPGSCPGQQAMAFPESYRPYGRRITVPPWSD